MGNTILAVDDSTTNNVLLEAVLKTKGYEIVLANSANEAFDKLKGYNIDLILLDLLMPEVDGFSFLEHVKNSIHTKHIPVIIVSAAKTSSNLAKAKQLGASDFMEKPIKINSFLEAIEAQIDYV